MRKKDKKIIFIILIFIAIIVIDLFLYYFLTGNRSNISKNTLVDINQNINTDIKSADINLNLFNREDFIQLEKNILIQSTSGSGDYDAVKRNPFKPFQK